jgi:DNA-binding beta-propeller fold protein YncE
MSRLVPVLSSAVVIACLAARAEDSQFARPKIGFVFDNASRKILTLSGIPGAALVTSPVALDFEVDRALVSSTLSFAIASAPDAPNLKFIRLPESGPVVTSIPDSLGMFDLGSLSRGGKAAIVYQSACRCVQVFSGLPDAPQLARTLTLAQDDSVVQAIAVTDDAAKFAIATRNGYSGEIAIHTADARSVNPVPADALSFSPDGASLAFADALQKTVSVLRDGNLIPIATGQNGIDSPAAIAYASAGKIVVADRGSKVHVIAIDNAQVVSIDCPCRPSALQPTSVENTFRISEIDSGSLWIVQLTDESARAMFIPVDRDGSTQTVEAAK